MTVGAKAPRPSVGFSLLRAAHLGPSLAVTTLVALLAFVMGLPTNKSVVITLAVFFGQLTVGWGNDLFDINRDRQVGRTDKPLATGEIAAPFVWRWLMVAASASVVLSLLSGPRSGAAHLVLGVTFGHLYNVYFKATIFSWLPYAVAFGALPLAVSLANNPSQWPPTWMVGTAAALGVAAHFLNVLPDLKDDEITGVQGLPHRLGAMKSRILATVLLVVASMLVVFGSTGVPANWAFTALVGVVALAGFALVAKGKTPFYAAITIALVNVALLIGAAR